MQLQIVLDAGALVPLRAHDSDAGYDLFSNEDIVIEAGGQGLINTGVKMAIPSGLYGKIFSRSGLALKGLEVGAGIIDSGYRGLIKVLLRNHGLTPYTIKKGDKIAQMIFMKYEVLNLSTVASLDLTDRNEGGFGSTGL